MTEPATQCPSAQAVGRIVGVDQLIQIAGTFGDTSDGIVCVYGRAGDPPDIDTSGPTTATILPAANSLSVSILQVRVDDPRAATTERISNSLVSQSDPLDIAPAENVTVSARYLRVGRPGSAWLLAKSAAVVTYINVRVAGADELSPDSARQQLRSLADLLGLGD